MYMLACQQGVLVLGDLKRCQLGSQDPCVLAYHPHYPHRMHICICTSELQCNVLRIHVGCNGLPWSRHVQHLNQTSRLVAQSTSLESIACQLILAIGRRTVESTYPPTHIHVSVHPHPGYQPLLGPLTHTRAKRTEEFLRAQRAENQHVLHLTFFPASAASRKFKHLTSSAEEFLRAQRAETLQV